MVLHGQRLLHLLLAAQPQSFLSTQKRHQDRRSRRVGKATGGRPITEPPWLILDIYSGHCLNFYHLRCRLVLSRWNAPISSGVELHWCRLYFHKLCWWMSWEGADGEDRLRATLTCPAELQCQEMGGGGWSGRRVLMGVNCARHVFWVALCS